MSPGQRIAALAVAVVVLVGAFVLTRSDEEKPRPTEPTTTVTPDTVASSATAPREETPAPPPTPREETIRVRDGKPVGEPKTIEYNRGDTVRLRFRSDAAGEVHIHVYDRYVQLEAGSPASTRFKADKEGVFEIEEHGTGALLAKLEVRP